MNDNLAKKRKRVIKVTDALRQMPEIFTANYLCNRMEYDPDDVKIAIYRWIKKNLIQPLGGRSEVYYNCMRGNDPAWRERGVAIADNTAIFTSATALRLAEWTTQIAQRPTVTLSSRLLLSTDYFNFNHRSMAWYRTVIGAVTSRPGSLGMLHPAWALVDALYHREDSWLPPPDDLDWSVIESISNRRALNEALTTLGAFYFRSAHKDRLPDLGSGDSIEDWYYQVYQPEPGMQFSC